MPWTSNDFPVKPERSLHELTEERLTAESHPMQVAWHRARYRLAARFVAHRRVLDAGSGEGYGAAMLAESASTVLGLDYSPAAIEHARSKYEKQNLRFEVADLHRVGDVTGQFDVITCFEVIEHLEGHEEVVRGLKRRLAPGGKLILSTPNSLMFHGGNEYHVREVTPQELRKTLRGEFSRVAMYGQIPTDRIPRTLAKGALPPRLRRQIMTAPAARKRVHDLIPPRREEQVPPQDFRFIRGLAASSMVVVAIANA